MYSYLSTLANEGKQVAPFKSQNMSGLSIHTEDGLEISVSQSLQARAAKIPYLAGDEPDIIETTREYGISHNYSRKKVEHNEWHALPGAIF